MSDIEERARQRNTDLRPASAGTVRVLRERVDELEKRLARVARLERILIARGLVSQWEINQPPPKSEEL